MSTIAAISTPNAVGGIAVIRISGENAIETAAKIFTPTGGKSVAEMPGYTCAYGIAHDGGKRIDDCILTIFRSPHSYTGEDTAEISCHGGLFVTKKILRAALKNGASPAEAGEFTKRAFLNGKLDLTRAEAVMDVISAKSELELKMASSLREGSVFRTADKCSKQLLALLSSLAAWVDYPDEYDEEVEPAAISAELANIRDRLSSLLANYESGRIVRDGIPTAIVGRPNVGKSTLFNCLSGCERSIVTNIAGTTRDVVEELVLIGDIALRLSDTAGIRDTEDIIEGIGVEFAWKTVDSAELVLAVFDGSCPLTADDFDVIERVKDKKVIAVINKSDKETVIDEEFLRKKFIQLVYISAKENDGISALEAAVKEKLQLDPYSFSTATAANERQQRCIETAVAAIDEAIKVLAENESLDIVNVLIDSAEQSLLELTGERVTDAVVDEVFSRFCVGK